MKKIFCFMLILGMGLTTVSVYALELSAECAVLYEPISDRFIFEKNKDAPRGIASTTKIVTAITALEYGDLSDEVSVSQKAAEIEGSSVWLEKDEVQTLENLLYALLLSSGNDAAVAVAEHIGGSEESFAQLMNQTARISGAKNSNFVNASGLDHENHYSTAADLARLMYFAEKNSVFSKIVATKSYEIPWEGHIYNRSLQNHNKLLTLYESCVGGKTGYTKKSGRCLVSSATQNGIHLISVTLNAPDDWNDHIKLFDYGFSVLQQQEVLKKNEFAGEFVVKNGQKNAIQTAYQSSFSIPMLADDFVTTENFFSKNTTAPIKQGAVVGYTDIRLNNKKIRTINIVAKESCLRIPEPSVRKQLSLFWKYLF